jgi:radical SAM enzyme (TIGR01210 family)
VGAIPAQIDFALARLSRATRIKLYNSGNFFDRQAIPRGDFPAIAERVRAFRTVIVESHPKLCGGACLEFRDMLAGELEIAIGLETVHPRVLERLNKRMTLDDFERATSFLRGQGIHVRAFILLRPPYLSEDEGLEWAQRSLEYAFGVGVECCTVIPTRAGNGVMEQLQSVGQFAPPQLTSLELVLAAGLALRRGRVFVDLWDIEKLFVCSHCGPARRERLRAMNLTQTVLPSVNCSVCGLSHQP